MIKAVHINTDEQVIIRYTTLKIVLAHLYTYRDKLVSWYKQYPQDFKQETVEKLNSFPEIRDRLLDEMDRSR